jgi:hypothetical protein
MDHNISPFLLKPKPTIDCCPQNIRTNSNIFPLWKNQLWICGLMGASVEA